MKKYKYNEGKAHKRIKFAIQINCCTFALPNQAGVLKLVDKPDLGSGAARRMGSIPFARTKAQPLRLGFFRYVRAKELSNDAKEEGRSLASWWVLWTFERKTVIVANEMQVSLATMLSCVMKGRFLEAEA